MPKNIQNNFNDTNEKKLLSPKNDVVFQVLFGEIGSENITKEFLQAILEENITHVDLSKNPVLRRLKPSNKMSVLDVIAEINHNEKCNIEMQVGKRDDIIRRILYYWARTYSRDLEKKERYETLQRTIAILITDFEIPGLEELGYFTKWKLIETKERKVILTEFMDVDIIELPKIYRLNENEKNNRLLDWMYFLENPDSEKVKRIMENNEGVKEAKEKLEEMSNDIIMQRIAEWEEAAEHDRASLEFTARNEGRKEGLKQGIEQGIEQGIKQGIEQGIERGIERGIEQGIEQGVKQGSQQEKLKIAKILKNKKMDVSFIVEVTGLTKEQINAI